MFLKVIFFYILIFLTFDSSSNSSVSVDPEFIRYYNDFNRIVWANCNTKRYRYPLNVTIKFGDLTKKSRAGETLSYDILGRHYSNIVIDKEYWPHTDKYALIIHELTHATFLFNDLRDEEYKYHYMYYKDTEVREKDARLQLIQLLRILCK